MHPQKLNFEDWPCAKIFPLYSNSYDMVLIINIIMINVWQVIFGGANFRGKLEEALKINFHDFKFCDTNLVQGGGTAQTMM